MASGAMWILELHPGRIGHIDRTGHFLVVLAGHSVHPEEVGEMGGREHWSDELLPAIQRSVLELGYSQLLLLLAAAGQVEEQPEDGLLANVGVVELGSLAPHGPHQRPLLQIHSS